MGTLHFLSRWKMALWEIGSWNCRLVVWELCISWSPPQKVGLKQNESWFYLHQPEQWNKSQAEFASTMTQDCMSRRARSASTQLWSRWLAVLCAFLLPRSTHLVSFQMVWVPGFASSVKRVRFTKKHGNAQIPFFSSTISIFPDGTTKPRQAPQWPVIFFSDSQVCTVDVFVERLDCGQAEQNEQNRDNADSFSHSGTENFLTGRWRWFWFWNGWNGWNGSGWWAASCSKDCLASHVQCFRFCSAMIFGYFWMPTWLRSKQSPAA